MNNHQNHNLIIRKMGVSPYVDAFGIDTRAVSYLAQVVYVDLFNK